MNASVAVADWIKRIADEERQRDLARIRDDETAARKAELVGRQGRRLLDDLRATVTDDAGAFRAEFAGDPTRNISVDATAADGGFVVRKPAPSAVSLAVTPTSEGGGLLCHYRFTLSDGLPPREERFEILLSGDGGEITHMKHHGTGRLFPTAAALSEFLLVPVLTGRPQ